MKAKNLNHGPRATKEQTLLIISLIGMAMGFLYPIMFAFGAVFLLFAVNAFVMKKHQTKLPKIFVRMNKINKESESSSIIALTTFTIISVLTVVMSSSGIQSDAVAVFVIFLMFVIPFISLILFLAYSISHISRKTESSLMLICRVISIVIAALVFYTSTSDHSSGSFSAIGVGLSGYSYAACALLVIGTFIPEKIFLSSQNIHKK